MLMVSECLAGFSRRLGHISVANGWAQAQYPVGAMLGGAR